MLNDQTLDLDPVRFEQAVDRPGSAWGGDPIIAGQRLGQRQGLAAIGRTGLRFDIADGCSIDDDVTGDRIKCAESAPGQFGAVFEHKADRLLPQVDILLD